MDRAAPLQKMVWILLFAFLFTGGLIYARPFLVPLCFGGLLAMLFIPVSLWFEKLGLSRGLGIAACILLFVGILAGIVWLISWQITDLASEATQVETRLRELIAKAQEFVRKHLGISLQQQNEFLGNQAQGAGTFVSRISSSLAGFFVDLILVLVYIFLFMYYRGRIKSFILQLIPRGEQKNAQEIIQGIRKVSQQYVTGLGLMILSLWIMYSIGFSIVGVRYAILFAILCGLFELVPFIGNLTGNALAVLMVMIQGGGVGMIVGVLVTYAIVQFVQSYFLEPLVVGAEVNINPLFTIIGLVAGELIWGIAGLVLAIPLMGIIKIICDHIEALKPYGYLIGSDGRKRRHTKQTAKR